ncbi:hypothetical protein LO771_24070 [Streptacidiphilus sp. ASG 303]|uniref:hypothetical protein n=1 Tax=Streptacidiphilus sp. ASG 303 TaxID=2896847 RepID=UPI001E48E142|nr:hypothetical protein [Streptacidiphilus sp. ASG 303]MCD0485380.1 hypothetical protein [Streptacidiphilus sp. ASG 303]
MSSEHTAGQPLLVVIDPAARRADGESVRIAGDVLRGAAAVKVAVPETAAELDRVLAHRGRKRPVVVGDDRALQRVVQTLHRQRELGAGAVGLIPVGDTPSTALARALGVPAEPVAAARAVLGGGERSLDLLVDDSGGVVLGGLCIPGRPPLRPGVRGGGEHRSAADAGAHPGAPGADGPPDGWPTAVRAYGDGDDPPCCSLSAKSAAAGQATPAESGWRSLLVPARLGRTARSLARAVLAGPAAVHDGPGQRLRIEADGTLLADTDRPVHLVAVRLAALAALHGETAWRPGPADGAVEVLVRSPSAAGHGLRVRARTVTVSGRGFSYEADSGFAGPVRFRTWTVRPAAWRLTVPSARHS